MVLKESKIFSFLPSRMLYLEQKMAVSHRGMTYLTAYGWTYTS